MKNDMPRHNIFIYRKMIDYINRLPIIINNYVLTCNSMCTLSVRIGNNPLYTDSIYVYNIYEKMWHDIEELNSTPIKINVNFPINLKILLEDEIMVPYLLKLGWIILTGRHLMLVLDLKTFENSYYGILDNCWKTVVNTKFFNNIITNFSHYLKEQYGKTDIYYTYLETDMKDTMPSNMIIGKKKLFTYQSQEVGWMYKLENYPYLEAKKEHLYTHFFDSGYYINLNNPDGLFKLKSTDNENILCPGGILASQIGCGKTLSMVGLITTKLNNANNNANNKNTSTLIILTKNILRQWYDEIITFNADISVLTIKDEDDYAMLLKCNYNVILINREFLEMDIHTNLLNIYFDRVIIDECHELIENNTLKINDMLTNIKKIKRKFTWGISATIQNISYLNVNSHKIFDLLNINVPEGLISLFTKTCIRRNTKTSNLKQINYGEVICSFSTLQSIMYQKELSYYNYMLTETTTRKLCSHLAPEWRFMENNNNIPLIIEHIRHQQQKEIIKLEQAPITEITKIRLNILKSDDNYFNNIIDLLSFDKAFFCPICYDDITVEQIVIPSCFHNLCKSCFHLLIKDFNKCSICALEYCKKNTIFIEQHGKNKMNQIIDEINKIPVKDKIIIFTQFNDLTDHLCQILKTQNIQHVILRGDTSDINISLYAFKYNPEIKVILMSVEQAASGINLQEANHVFFAHPVYYNDHEQMKITYNQCVGRAYRVGQTKNVNVKLFITQNSTEENYVWSFRASKDFF